MDGLDTIESTMRHLTDAAAVMHDSTVVRIALMAMLPLMAIVLVVYRAWLRGK